VPLDGLLRERLSALTLLLLLVDQFLNHLLIALGLGAEVIDYGFEDSCVSWADCSWVETVRLVRARYEAARALENSLAASLILCVCCSSIRLAPFPVEGDFIVRL